MIDFQTMGQLQAGISETAKAFQLFGSLLEDSPQQDQSGNQSNQAMPNLQDNMGEILKGVAMNPLGRIQMIGRLESKFGVDYQTNPDALKIAQEFETKMNQSQDIASLQSVTKQAKKVEDYILSQKPITINGIQKLP